MKHRANTCRETVLAALPATQAEIHDKTGVSQAAISRWMTYLRACGDAHIGDWKERDNKFGTPQAIYHPGPGADVVCTIRPMTQKERDRRSRAVRRKSGDWEDRKASERSRYWRDRAPRRDPLMAAFFGVI